MVDPLAARANQLRHIEAKTGQRFAQLCALITTSGLAEVGEQLMAAIAALGAFEIAPKKKKRCLPAPQKAVCDAAPGHQRSTGAGPEPQGPAALTTAEDPAAGQHVPVHRALGAPG